MIIKVFKYLFVWCWKSLKITYCCCMFKICTYEHIIYLECDGYGKGWLFMIISLWLIVNLFLNFRLTLFIRKCPLFPYRARSYGEWASEDKWSLFQTKIKSLCGLNVYTLTFTNRRCVSSTTLTARVVLK